MHLENQKQKSQRPKAKKETFGSAPRPVSVRESGEAEWLSHFFHQIFYHMFPKR